MTLFKHHTDGVDKVPSTGPKMDIKFLTKFVERVFLKKLIYNSTAERCTIPTKNTPTPTRKEGTQYVGLWIG